MDISEVKECIGWIEQTMSVPLILLPSRVPKPSNNFLKLSFNTDVQQIFTNIVTFSAFSPVLESWNFRYFLKINSPRGTKKRFWHQYYYCSIYLLYNSQTISKLTTKNFPLFRCSNWMSSNNYLLLLFQLLLICFLLNFGK